MELEFKSLDSNGEEFNFKLNDSSIAYKSLRENVPESVLIDAIEQIKKKSGKKCAMTFGNCQARRLFQVLKRHVQFRKEYFFLSIPEVFRYTNEMIDLIFGGGGQFLQLVDLFISQHVKETNKFGASLATRNISNKLSESCKIIWIPNAYFTGYFPQLTTQTHKIIVDGGDTRFPHGDRYIDEIMEKSGMNPDIDAILDKLSSPDFISTEDIQTEMNRSIGELTKREWLCDVKVSRFVEDNVFGKQIFFSQNHPSSEVVMEIAHQVLRFIGMRSNNFIELKNIVDVSNLDFSAVGQDIPIYPSVKNFFKFQESLDTYWANRYSWDFQGNFKDFQRAYIRQCWAEKFTK